MIDTEQMRKLVNSYLFNNNPQGSSNQPCTVQDVKKVKEDTAKLLIEMIKAIEES